MCMLIIGYFYFIALQAGETALKIALDSGYDNVVELLRDCTQVIEIEGRNEHNGYIGRGGTRGRKT